MLKFVQCSVVIISLLAYTQSYSLFGGSDKKNESHEDDSFDVSSDNIDKNENNGSCPVVEIQLGGAKWILHVRRDNYGWKDDTHRAVIALAVSGWKDYVKEGERRLMEQQLEVEITKGLLRNTSSPIYPNNLALYIHALIAINRNPRDFHGIDLVLRLLNLIKSTSYLHPFLMLVLCNAKSFDPYYINVLDHYLKNAKDSRQNMEYTALALQAYECAATLKINGTIQPNGSVIREAQRYLAKQQDLDGSFGNVYTTALVVQALMSAPLDQWNREGAMKYLKLQSYIEVNMVSAYLIELALNCGKVRFIKDLHPDLPMNSPTLKTNGKKFVQYSLRVGSNPDVIHTITINVPLQSNFFEVMKLSAEVDPKYNFSYYLDKNEEPSIYSISNIPNDAEENMYWRLCLQTGIKQNHSYRISNHNSPANLHPHDNDHVIYWYNNKNCDETRTYYGPINQ